MEYCLYPEQSGGGTAERALGVARMSVPMLRLVPLHRELVRCAHDQPAVVECDRHGRFEPGPHRRVGKFASRLVEQALPGFFSRLLHRRMTKVGRPEGRPETTPRMWKSQP